MAEEITEENIIPGESIPNDTDQSIDGLLQEDEDFMPTSDDSIAEDNFQTEPADDPIIEDIDSNNNDFDIPEETNQFEEDLLAEEAQLNEESEQYEEDNAYDEEFASVVNPDHNVQKKQTQLQKILMIVIGVLAGILLFGFILYLFGVFDPDEPPMPTPEQLADMNATKKPEKYIYDSKDIQIDRLNEKLKLLTKYEIIGTKEEEYQKELEKNAELSTAQIEELIEKERARVEAEKKKAEEEKKKAEEAKIAEEKRKAEEAKMKEEKPYDLLKFVQVVAPQSVLASLDSELKELKVSITHCEDKTQKFLLIGPFKTNKDINHIFRKVYDDITKNSSKKDLARLEFNRICK